MSGHFSTRGADYVFQGVREFYKHKQLWKYAIPPFVITLIANIAAVCFLIMKGLPVAEHYLAYVTSVIPPSVAEPVHAVFTILIWLTFLMSLSALSYTLFEFTGCFLFAAMVACYEQEILHSCNVPISTKNKIRDMVESVFYTIGTVILTALLSVLGFFLPLVTEFIKAFAIGYRYAVSYASEAGFNRNIRLPNMPKLIPSSVTASFGVTVYFLLLLPFISLFLIPGFFIGGTIMADREIP
jgi:uncharacterized protein involved in cysteine biosynthesis